MNQIVTKSEYSKDVHKKFVLFSTFRRSFSFYFMIIITIILGIYIITNAINSEEKEALIPSIIIVAVVLIMTPTIMITRISSSLNKDEESRKGILETIIINKEKVSRKLDGSESVVISWKQVEKVYERKDCFYFFLNGDQSLIVDKSKFVEGSNEVLIKLIEKYGPRNKKGRPVLVRLKEKK